MFSENKCEKHMAMKLETVGHIHCRAHSAAVRGAQSMGYLLFQRRIDGRFHQIDAIGARECETDRAGAHREQENGDGGILRRKKAK